MALLPGLQLNVSQQLKLTPQLQQSIKILQYSAIELQEAIEAALDENIMLELVQDEVSEESTLIHANQQEQSNKAENHSEQELYGEASDFEQLNSSVQSLEQLSEQQANDIADSVDYNWEESFEASESHQEHKDNDFNDYRVSNHRDDDEYTSPENYTSQHEDLYGHLSYQVETFNWRNDEQQAIALYLIDAVNDQGYLAVECHEIAEHINENEMFSTNERQVEQTLKLIQDNFTPAGVAARDVQECLFIQIAAIIPQTTLTKACLRLIGHHFDDFAKGDANRIKRANGWKDDDWQAMIELIQACNPKPGLAFANSEQEVIIPDLVIKRSKQGWLVSLNSRAYPHVQVNNEYVDLLKQIDKKDKQNAQTDTLKDKLGEAKNLIKSIQSRGETLLKVGAYLVEEQAAFLEEGEVAMKPLVLRDVADALDLHESTISRATTQKYMQTPRGTYELKYFFSSSVSQYGPQDQSAVAIKARIKQLIDGEDPKKPISDQYIVEQLEVQKISVARRTVAKYREALGIPSSSNRKVRV